MRALTILAGVFLFFEAISLPFFVAAGESESGHAALAHERRPQCAAPEPHRTWVDQQGRRIVASFRGWAENSSAILLQKRGDSRVYRVRVQALSVDDKAYLGFLSAEQFSGGPFIAAQAPPPADDDAADAEDRATVVAQAFKEAGQMLVGYLPWRVDEAIEACKRAGATIVEVYGTGSFIICSWPEGSSGAEIAAALENETAITYVVPNLKLRLGPPAPQGGAANAQQPYGGPSTPAHYGGVVPNDPHFPRLWGMRSIRAPQAWRCTRSTSVLVCVLDTGVDYLHEDLRQNIWRNPYEIPRDGLDNDGNGVVDDVHGFDPANGDGDPYDFNGHGSHVAGTIGAVGNNCVGVVGVNWKIQMMAVKVFRDSGLGGDMATLIKGIDYARLNRAKVINASLGYRPLPPYFRPFFQPLRDAIARTETAGMLFVVAAGNDFRNDNDVRPVWPASFADPRDPDGPISTVISVASLDINEQLSNFSNVGRRSVHLAAPGGFLTFNSQGQGISDEDDILSVMSSRNQFPPTFLAIDSRKYVYLMGTSMATPHVTGAAALVWGYRPFATASARDIKGLVLSRGRRLGSLSGLLATEATLDLSFVCPDCHPISCHCWRCDR